MSALEMIQLTRRIDELEAENAKLRKAIGVAIPIVEAAFWDHYTAGNLPGSGYNHKVYHKVSAAFGWRESKTFEKWRAEALAALRESPAQGEEGE